VRDFGHILCRAAGNLSRSDGVIVEDVDYLARARDLRTIAGSAQAVARCNQLEIPLVLVLNQSGNLDRPC
jgi:histidinol phosphatase-like enzyme